MATVTAGLPEPWLRGPVAGVDPALVPVAHLLIQAAEDIPQLASDLSTEDLWRSPGGAAAVGYHLRHLAGSLDRLFTYARGEQLSKAQRSAMAAEKTPAPETDAATLVRNATAAIDRAMEQLKRTPADQLNELRGVGRAKLPSTVLGLLVHAAAHTARHVGQIATTVRILHSQRRAQSS
jgi:uncharacterized damage-inducible protein DinB